MAMQNSLQENAQTENRLYIKTFMKKKKKEEQDKKHCLWECTRSLHTHVCTCPLKMCGSQENTASPCSQTTRLWLI